MPAKKKQTEDEPKAVAERFERALRKALSTPPEAPRKKAKKKAAKKRPR